VYRTSPRSGKSRGSALALSHRHQRGAHAPPGRHAAGRIAGSVPAQFDATGAMPASGAAGRRACRRTARSAVLAEEATAALDGCPTSIAVRSCCVIWKLTTAEVADARLEPATVRQRVHRARLMLRGYLGALAGVRP
jgi:hypothetical protein